MRRLKKVLAVILSLAFLLQGCGIKRDAFLEKTPYDVKEEYQEERVIFLSDVPSGKYPMGNFSKNFTVYAADKRMQEMGGTWKWFKLRPGEQLAVDNLGGKGKKKKIYRVLLDGTHHKQMSIPAQLIMDRKLTDQEIEYLGRLIGQNRHVSGIDAQTAIQEFRKQKPYVRVYQVKFIGWCGNAIPLERKFYVLECPAVVRITEKYSWSPWVIGGAFLAGALAGLGLGWFGKTAAVTGGSQQVATASGAPCPPGGIPAPY